MSSDQAPPLPNPSCRMLPDIGSKVIVAFSAIPAAPHTTGSENFEAISVGKEEVSQLIAVAEDEESSSLRLLKPMQRHVQIVRVPEIIERTKTASSGSSPLNRAYTRVNQRENLGFRVRPFGFTESSKRSKRKRPHSSSKKAKKKKSKKQDKRKKDKKKEI